MRKNRGYRTQHTDRHGQRFRDGQIGIGWRNVQIRETQRETQRERETETDGDRQTDRQRKYRLRVSRAAHKGRGR